MIKNFNGLKKQLRELSAIINSFKSEAVQLRLVDLIFQGTDIAGEEEGTASRGTQRTTTKRKPTKATKKKAEAKDKKTAKAGRVGPATTLTQLIGEQFFQSKRTITDIINHAEKKKAHKFKANELSGSLARFVRDGRLDRDENKEGQYEYYKK